MRLLLDCGNTRLKWRMVQGPRAHGLQACEGSLGWEEFSPQDLAEDWQQAVCQLGSPQDHPRGGFCSVAAPMWEARARAALEAFCASAGVYTLSSCSESVLHRAGQTLRLVNPYARPGSLGHDRWAAALGLLAELFDAEQGSPSQPDRPGPPPKREAFDVAIVSAGTALVVDQLHCRREPRGWTCQLLPGAIQPGLGVSARALAQAAPALREGLEAALARPAEVQDQASTQQAIARGLMASQLGPLVWMHQVQPIDLLWLHGGDADWWQSALQQSPWGQVWSVNRAPLIFSGLLAAMTPGCAE